VEGNQRKSERNAGSRGMPSRGNLRDKQLLEEYPAEEILEISSFLRNTQQRKS
jgi:hypothetical protein